VRYPEDRPSQNEIKKRLTSGRDKPHAKFQP